MAGAADDRAVQPRAEADEICPGQERAHAVTENEIRLSGILRRRLVVQRADILHRLFPAVFLAEKAEMRFVRRALSVAELVVQHHDVAVFGEKRGKRVVPGDMLGDAVHDLNDADGVSLREIFTRGERRLPVRR